MYSFVVLGYVPGTHLQITFRTWLYGAGGLLIVGLTLSLIRQLWQRRTLVTEPVPVRQPVHARQLHQR